METKVVSFEQMPELIQNLVERIEALEKTVREKQQPQPLEGELMSVDDVCKMLGKSKSAVYRTVRCHDIPFIRQGNRLYFDRPTIKKWLEKKQNIECITNMEEFEKFMTPDSLHPLQTGVTTLAHLRTLYRCRKFHRLVLEKESMCFCISEQFPLNKNQANSQVRLWVFLLERNKVLDTWKLFHSRLLYVHVFLSLFDL